MKRAVQLAVAVGLLALLWRAADGRAALERLAGAEGRWLLLALVALTVQTVLSAWRWRLTAGRLGIEIAPRHAIREYYLGQVVNQSVPGGVLGDAGRAYRARAAAGMLPSAQAVVIERLAGQIALFLTLAVAFAVTSALPGGVDWPRGLALPVAGFVVAGLCLPLALRAATRLGGRIGPVARDAKALLRRTLTARDVWLAQAALSVGTTLCNLAAFAFCARAVGVGMPVAVVAAFVPLILLTMLIPVSISGWGLREGAAAALLPLAGVEASAALAASVAFGLTLLVSVLPGVGLLLVGSRARAP